MQFKKGSIEKKYFDNRRTNNSRFSGGFTLIELLAVVIMLEVFGLIAVLVVNQLMKNSKEKAYLSQIEMLQDTSLR